jgi:hypothetical protein
MNLEERRSYNRAWYAKNRKTVRARTDAWRSENSARVKQYTQTCYGRRPFVYLINGAKKRAAKQGIPFALTTAWAEARWTGLCELTKLAFRSQVGKGRHGPFSPSIDKIVPANGYVPDNCRFVLMAVNQMKSTGTDSQMYEIAEALLRNKK